MNRQMFEPDKDVDFKFDGPEPPNDLINYSNMMMEMNHTAATSGGCVSFLVFSLFVVFITLAIAILINMLFLG